MDMKMNMKYEFEVLVKFINRLFKFQDIDMLKRKVITLKGIFCFIFRCICCWRVYQNLWLAVIYHHKLKTAEGYLFGFSFGT